MRSTASQRRLPARATRSSAGIVTIPQELRLVPALSIAENLALGDLPSPAVRPAASSIVAACAGRRMLYLAELDFVPDPDPPVRTA